jgi:hypothetical protein
LNLQLKKLLHLKINQIMPKVLLSFIINKIDNKHDLVTLLKDLNVCIIETKEYDDESGFRTLNFAQKTYFYKEEKLNGKTSVSVHITDIGDFPIIKDGELVV